LAPHMEAGGVLVLLLALLEEEEEESFPCFCTTKLPDLESKSFFCSLGWCCRMRVGTGPERSWWWCCCMW
jgi:hypothetical protein